MCAVIRPRKIEMPAAQSGYNANVVVFFGSFYKYIWIFGSSEKGCKRRARYLAFIAHFFTYLAYAAYSTGTGDKGS